MVPAPEYISTELPQKTLSNKGWLMFMLLVI
jgi:hypothetical protein